MTSADGDKFLCEGLTNRQILLHGRIKGYGDNVGSKGNQANFRPLTDDRYGPFLKAVGNASFDQRFKIADYLAQRFAESRRVPSPLPPVGDDVLTFARAKDLFHRLISAPSGRCHPAVPDRRLAVRLSATKRDQRCHSPSSRRRCFGQSGRRHRRTREGRTAQGV